MSLNRHLQGEPIFFAVPLCEPDGQQLHQHVLEEGLLAALDAWGQPFRPHLRSPGPLTEARTGGCPAAGLRAPRRPGRWRSSGGGRLRNLGAGLSRVKSLGRSLRQRCHASPWGRSPGQESRELLGQRLFCRHHFRCSLENDRGNVGPWVKLSRCVDCGSSVSVNAIESDARIPPSSGGSGPASAPWMKAKACLPVSNGL